MSPNQERTLWLAQAFEQKGNKFNSRLLARALETTPDCAESICQVLLAKGYLVQSQGESSFSYRLTGEGQKALRELLVRRAESLEHFPDEFMQMHKQLEDQLNAGKTNREWEMRLNDRR